MKLFICWSGERSMEIAAFLRDWLPTVHQNVKPFMSAEDIGKGTRWTSNLARELEATDFGIICLTSDNLTSPWLHFEVGALSKITSARVVPILYKIKTSDVQGPLSDFQAAPLENKDEMRRVLTSINEAMGDRANQNWRGTFNALWPQGEEKIHSLAELDRIQISCPTDGGILEEPQKSGNRGFTYVVRGALKHLPKNNSIWLLAASDKGEQWPQDSAMYEPASGKWEGRVYLQTWYHGTFINALVAPTTSQQLFEYCSRYGNGKPLSGIPNECENIAGVWALNPNYSPT
jgi:TIR domain